MAPVFDELRAAAAEVEKAERARDEARAKLRELVVEHATRAYRSP